MLVWKYMPYEYAFDSIKSGWFKVARPSELNDPQEMRCKTIGMLSEQVKSELVQKYYKAINEGRLALPDGRRIGTEEVVRKRIDMDGSAIFDSFTMNQLEFNRYDRLMCFANAQGFSQDNDQLLWGHYASGGRGVRILFDIPKSDSRLRFELFQVKYDNIRPILDISKFKEWMDQNVFVRFIRQAFRQKSTVWAYENEVRMMIPINGNIIISRKSGNQEIDFIKVPYDWIRKIDFGPLTYFDDSVCQIDMMLSFCELRHLEFRVAQFDGIKYSYKYVPHVRAGELRAAIDCGITSCF